MPTAAVPLATAAAEPGLEDSHLYNADLAPVPASQRTWSVWNFAALWISMSACIPTYMLASSLIGGGMNWSEAVGTIFLGNLIVLAPMILNAHAGTKYGIPFPVFCRASFGTTGANVPALLRALVACGWFGIQTWIGGNAVYQILGVFFPSLTHAAPLPVLDINAAQLVCFLGFWAVNIFVIYRGIDSIRFLLSIKAPLLIFLGLALLVWAYRAAGGFGPILSQPSAFAPGQPKAGQFYKFFAPALTGMISFWATLSLNIPDFSPLRPHPARPGRRARRSACPRRWPSTVSSAWRSPARPLSSTEKRSGTRSPSLTHFQNPVVLVIAMLALCVATLATNLAANVVGPANDFAALAPKRISFRTGGLITGIIGILIMPWKLVADPSGYIFTWLVGYSALLGPIAGILIADYFVLRRRTLDVKSLYSPTGSYTYTNGYSLAGLGALILAILPNLPGFLVTVKWLPATAVPAFLVAAYDYRLVPGFRGGLSCLLGFSQTLFPRYRGASHYRLIKNLLCRLTLGAFPPKTPPNNWLDRDWYVRAGWKKGQFWQ